MDVQDVARQQRDAKNGLPDVPVIELVGVEAKAIDPLVAKRVLRKLDCFLMPAMVIGRSTSIIGDMLLS
jgi:hypothetical protein